MVENNINNALISVVLPCYNCKRYIEDAVRSIQKQTYSNLEILIVDDASNDGSLQVLQRIVKEDDRIVLIQHEKNMGLVYSLNELISKAKGTYIARMDADDISDIKRFEVQIDFLNRNPQVDICGTGAEIIDSRGLSHGRRTVPEKHEDILEMLSIFNPMIHSSIMARSQVLKENMYKQEYMYSEDYELWCRLVFRRNYKFANIDLPLLKYRFTNEQVCQKHRMEQGDSSERVIVEYKLVNMQYSKIHKNIFFMCQKGIRIDTEVKTYIKEKYKMISKLDFRFSVVPMTTIIAFIKKNSLGLLIKYIFTPLGIYTILQRILRRKMYFFQLILGGH